MRRVVVPVELQGALDRAVRALFPALGQPTAWGKARAWIMAGKVRVGEAVVTEVTARVNAGESISLDERAPRPRALRLPDHAVLHVDAHLVVVSKPAGVSSVPYDKREKITLDASVRDWLACRAARTGSIRPNLGVVHRLDKDTSGLVVFTRTWLAKKALSLQFRRHTVHRKYLAIAHGHVTSRTIRSLLVEDRGDGLRGSVRRTQGGRIALGNAREAITHVEALESLPDATLVACRLETGRTHQIRIHLSEAGHPLLGERVYRRGFGGVVLEAPRLMLHAAELGFVHPATGRILRWEQPIPEDMRQVLKRLRR